MGIDKLLEILEMSELEAMNTDFRDSPLPFHGWLDREVIPYKEYEKERDKAYSSLP